MSSPADINVRIGAEIKQLKKGLRNSEKVLRKTARKFSDYGNRMTAAVTIPVAGFLGRSVQLFDKQAQSIAQVEAGLKSTNGTVGHTSEALQKMASDLQGLSTIGDDEILKKVTANLLTFTQITNEQFPRAQQAILDMSTRLGSDLKGSALQVGKALNDPIKGVSALAKSGIQFSESQKTMIKSLVDTGNISKAQTIILKELENQFGGSAKAAAEAGLGPIKQFNNSLGDMMETVGGAVLPALTDLVKYVTNLFKKFDALEDSTKKNIIQTALYAAAVGPVLKVVGLAISGYRTWLGIKTALIIATKKFTFSIKGLTVAMAANPVGFLVAALAAVATGLVIAYNKSQRFRATIAGLGNYLKEFFTIIKEGFSRFAEGFAQLKEGNFGAAYANFKIGMAKANPLRAAFGEGERLAKAYSDGYKNKIASEAAAMQEKAVEAVSIPINPITPTSSTSPTKSGGGGSSKGGAIERLNKAIPTLTSLKSITAGLVESSTAASVSFEGFGTFLEKVNARAEMLRNTLTPMQSLMSNLGNEIGGAFDRGIKSVKDFGRAALDAIAKVIGGIIKQGVARAIANVLGSSPLGLFLAPAAGAAASALFKGAINKIKAPRLAKGGAAYGMTSAIIGDNVNARSNPEVVTPANTLPGIFRKAFDKDGGINVGGGKRLVAEIQGDKFLFWLDNQMSKRKRMGLT